MCTCTCMRMCVSGQSAPVCIHTGGQDPTHLSRQAGLVQLCRLQPAQGLLASSQCSHCLTCHVPSTSSCFCSCTTDAVVVGKTSELPTLPFVPTFVLKGLPSPNLHTCLSFIYSYGEFGAVSSQCAPTRDRQGQTVVSHRIHGAPAPWA